MLTHLSLNLSSISKCNRTLR